MNSFPIEVATSRSRSFLALWALLAFFAAANVLPVFPHAWPPVLYAAAQIVPAMLFAFLHSARVYGLRGSLTFAAISLVVGYVMEAIGVRTGFPFGHYYFTEGMGPKLFSVPILMGPAYLGMGYVSWAVARGILNPDDREDSPAGARLVMLPLAASFVMVAWDLCFDPALSTFGRYWVWTQGGAYFGVPVSNFLGWLLTNYLIYQLFALHLRRSSTPGRDLKPAAARLAVIFYAVCAAGCVLRAASTPVPAAVADATGTIWRVADINNVCAMTAIFVMGSFAVLAATRLIGRAQEFRLAAELPGRRFQPVDSLPQPGELESTR
jgi:putative membrane protein